MSLIFQLAVYLWSLFLFCGICRKKGFLLTKEAFHSLDSTLKFRHLLAALFTWFFGQVIIASTLSNFALQERLGLNFRQFFCFIEFFSTTAIILCLVAIIRWRKLHILGSYKGIVEGARYAMALQLPIMLLMTALQYITLLFGPAERGNEVCENLLKECELIPWLYIMSFFSFAVLCPIVEELLFRGFLQNWLTNMLDAKGAIIITSILFALVHYSPEQGAANIDLLIAIFSLSLVFGLVYFRTRSLVASVSMHITNNVIALILRSL